MTSSLSPSRPIPRLPLLLLLLLAPPSAPAGALTPEQNRAIARAERKLEQGRIAEARGDLLRLLPDATTEARLYHLLGRAYHELGQFEFAAESLRRGIALETDGRTRRSQERKLAAVEAEAKRGARTLADRDAAASGGALQARAKSGLLYEAADDPAAALAEYEAMKRDLPSQAAGYFLAGRLHLGLGDRAAAEREFREFFARRPGDTAAVELLFRQGFAPEEIAALGFAGVFPYGKLEAAAAEAEFQRGLRLHWDGRDEAPAVLAHAVALNPDHLRARVALAECRFDRGDLDGAFDETLQILRLDKRNWRARELRYHIFRRWSYPVEALKELDDGLAADTDAVRLRLLRGLHLAADPDRRREAYVDLKRAIELDPMCKEAADALAGMGLSFNRIRALGYRGIQLPVKFAMKDKVFIPREKATPPGFEGPMPDPYGGMARASSFPQKGPAAKTYRERRRERLEAERRWRAKRRAARRSAEVELTGEVSLTGEAALRRGTGEASLRAPAPEPPPTLEAALAAIDAAGLSPARAKAARESAERLFPGMDERRRRAFISMWRNRAAEDPGAPDRGGTLETELAPPGPEAAPAPVPVPATGEVTLPPPAAPAPPALDPGTEFLLAPAGTAQ